MTCNLGIPFEFDNPKFRTAVRTVFKKSRAAGIGAGMHHACIPPKLERQDQGEDWLKDGCNLFVHATDFDLFKRTLKNELAYFKNFVGDKRKAGGKGDNAVV